MEFKTKVFTNEVNLITHEVDYLNFVTKSSTAEQRRRFDVGDIFINAAVCRNCGDYIRSINRHDFKTCKCGAVTIDGGSWYIKRLGDPTSIINVIEYFYDTRVIQKYGNTKKKKK